VLAELGNLDRFDECKNVLSWAGVVPNVTETAGRTKHGKVKKASSSWLRRTLHLIAQGVRSKGSECLKEFYNKIKQKHGSFKALVALSRKILKILYHMLKKHEMYNESKLVSGFDNKYRRVRKSKNAFGTLQKSYSISVA
jgi:transposase